MMINMVYGSHRIRIVFILELRPVYGACAYLALWCPYDDYLFATQPLAVKRIKKLGPPKPKKLASYVI